MYGTGNQPLYSPNLRGGGGAGGSMYNQPTYQSTQSLPPQPNNIGGLNPSFLAQQQQSPQPMGLQQRSYSTGDLKTSIRSGEQKNKVVTENIEKIENHFPQMVQDINLYTVRSAKLRDAGDQFSKSLRQYAGTEVPALQQGLGAFAECFAAVQDHRNALVTRLENRVVQGFAVYETRCKQARVDVKQHNTAHTKEVREHKSFENVKSKSTQQFELAKAETKFKKAAEEANRSANTLKDQISDFERQKTRDLKKVFGEFMLSEMMFYAKALEIYTRAYQELNEIDEEEGIDQLHQSLKLSQPQLTPGGGGGGYMYGGSAPTLATPQHQPHRSHSASTPQLERTF
ncbi:CBY1-interacting BAR domain-containing protein 1-like isoform X2 [Clytia hemisphaerica]|uniref:Uncharacterized protein n=1 Tax=Clytia hemisphaerica TaxID=252671 RepID=A0A7M6DP10_9CNID